ncbi:lytic transglycosylase domain-containing protein [Fibrisoma montanum]|uniref:Lytic transglycosylase domain-containing protein n=1 Tax=Fibrisoma montanum TaxID=2305895 RepID=A0A418M9E7_9BACT|nr:lytic transglycosylase domain-containing protein [Fibrisoma montanum]RIV22729.1 lytic transglycosylase domain-containing protein [Fibrisoma montanum]
MAAIKPVAGPTKMVADTGRTSPLSNGLNSPALLVVDSSKRVFPIYFCGEEVPVDQPRVARRWVQTLRTYGAQPECLVDLRKRAADFFPIIDPILRKYRIPRDFRFLPLAESALVNDCVSPKGASGYWQLMPETARELGLKVNGTVDERYDLQKATVAVCRYLHQLYAALGSWTLVAAAYNGGITRIQNKIEQQGHSNYYRLRLHRETSHYLFRVLAYKELLSNPRQYALLLSQNTVAQLTKPLPKWSKPLALTPKIKDAPTVQLVDDEPTDPTWGPRPNKSLTKAPSDTQQWLASVSRLFNQKNAGITEQHAALPITKLMAMMVLRFRRPRFLQLRKGEGHRPLHFWDWI